MPSPSAAPNHGPPASTASAPCAPARGSVRPAGPAPGLTIPREPASRGSDPGAPGDDGPLLRRLKAREDGAFEELVRLHGHRMLAVARRFFREEADAQDALQDALLNVHRSVDRFSGDSRLATWLHRVVVNASLMRLRARKRRPELPLDPSAVGEAPRTTEDDPSGVVGSMACAETRARVRACIARVPEAQRTVLLLRDIEGMRLEEIAGLLEVTPGTVKMRLHRGRQLLRELLSPYVLETRP